MAARDEELTAALAQAEGPVEDWRAFQPSTASASRSKTSAKRGRELYEAASAAEDHVQKLARTGSGRVHVPCRYTTTAQYEQLQIRAQSPVFSAGPSSSSGPTASSISTAVHPSPFPHTHTAENQRFTHVSIWAQPESQLPWAVASTQSHTPSSFDVALGLDSMMSSFPDAGNSHLPAPQTAMESQLPLFYPPGYTAPPLQPPPPPLPLTMLPTLPAAPGTREGEHPFPFDILNDPRYLAFDVQGAFLSDETPRL
ncbi:hypothetical protein AURDEDRAFT_164997 [Auricularia subglabra TFB-10046 SS5]|nr:hypothetical protein AURDEDRAFT_164997 [Auricularia subglabra TFB-10046 SS5]